MCQSFFDKSRYLSACMHFQLLDEITGAWYEEKFHTPSGKYLK